MQSGEPLDTSNPENLMPRPTLYKGYVLHLNFISRRWYAIPRDAFDMGDKITADTAIELRQSIDDIGGHQVARDPWELPRFSRKEVVQSIAA
jgi:hypothetical protein